MFKLTAYKLNAIFESTRNTELVAELSITLPALTQEEKCTVEIVFDRLKLNGFVVARRYTDLSTVEIVL